MIYTDTTFARYWNFATPRPSGGECFCFARVTEQLLCTELWRRMLQVQLRPLGVDIKEDCTDHCMWRRGGNRTSKCRRLSLGSAKRKKDKENNKTAFLKWQAEIHQERVISEFCSQTYMWVCDLAKNNMTIHLIAITIFFFPLFKKVVISSPATLLMFIKLHKGIC